MCSHYYFRSKYKKLIAKHSARVSIRYTVKLFCNEVFRNSAVKLDCNTMKLSDIFFMCIEDVSLIENVCGTFIIKTLQTFKFNDIITLIAQYLSL